MCKATILNCTQKAIASPHAILMQIGFISILVIMHNLHYSDNICPDKYQKFIDE